jgi:hypothetical protein
VSVTRRRELLRAFEFTSGKEPPPHLPLHLLCYRQEKFLLPFISPLVIMPPRKSDVAKVATGDEGTPAKDQLPRDGINVEVWSKHSIACLAYFYNEAILFTA